MITEKSEVNGNMKQYPKLAWPYTKKRKSKCKTIRKYFGEFADSTSMHGLKYVADKETTSLEKLLWVAAFLACFSAAGYFIWGMWIAWGCDPVLISLDSNEYPTEDLLFPAVSICSVNKVSNARLKLYLENSVDIPKVVNSSVVLALLSSMIRSGVADIDVEQMAELEKILDLQDFTAEGLIEFMEATAVPCESIMLGCKWQNEIIDCSQLFELQPSSEGFCCVFNGNAFNTLTDPNSNLRSSKHESLPLKAQGDGIAMGISVMLDAQLNDYALTTAYFYGFKVLVHHPEDQPDPTRKGIAVGPGTEVFTAISTSSIQSTDDIKYMDIESRKCRFSYENNLKYFKKYSKNNCLTEHMAKTIQNDCRCIPFYFLVGDKEAPVCSFNKNSCIHQAISKFYTSGVSKECHANCDSVSYTSEVSYGPFPNQLFNTSYLNALLARRGKNKLDYLRSNVALLHVFFRDNSGIQYSRAARYKWQDFVSSVGGLLGLAVGFSLMSLLEIFYFFGLRWFLRIGKRQRQSVTDVQPRKHVPFFVTDMMN